MIRLGLSSFLVALFVLPTYAGAASGSAPFYVPDVRIDVTNTDSIQRGAKIFFSTCVSCHSLKFMRYQRIADDLGYSKETMQELNFMQAGTTMSSPVITALSPDAALSAYGTVPPDLSLKAREKGTAWLHKFLMSYYQDKNSKTGFNNAFFPNTSMPNLLIGQQGIQEPVYSTDSEGKRHLTGLKQKTPGQLSQKQFYNEMKDIVTFLDYASEPSKIERLSLAPFVFLFLFGLLILFYLLKREYWKDVH